MNKRILLLLPAVLLIFLMGCATVSVYKQEFHAAEPFEGIEVDIKPSGQVWNLVIHNNTADMVSFLIDRSIYVETDRQARRLIRERHRWLFVFYSQPPVVIPPQSKYSIAVLRENSTHLGDFQLAYPAQPKKPEEPGRFYFSLRVGDRKEILIYEVRFIKVDEERVLWTKTRSPGM